MYTHFQQIIRHRCVRAFQTRRGCAYGTHAPARNIGRGEKPAGHAAVLRLTLASGPAPHAHKKAAPQM